MKAILAPALLCFAALFVPYLSGAAPQEGKQGVKIEFIGMRGCPNSPRLLRALKTAMRHLGLRQAILMLDADELSGNKDVRAGYGAPTILLDGVDLYGTKPASTFSPSCRVYRPRLPDAKDIGEKLSVFPGAAGRNAE